MADRGAQKRATDALIDSLPDLDDMLMAGMSLTEALAHWHRMMSGLDRGADYWWETLKTWRGRDLVLQ